MSSEHHTTHLVPGKPQPSLRVQMFAIMRVNASGSCWHCPEVSFALNKKVRLKNAHF